MRQSDSLFTQPSSTLLRVLLLAGLLNSAVCGATPDVPVSQVSQVSNALIHQEMPEKYRAFFKSYCTECHGEEKQKGKVRLDNIPFALDTLKQAEDWAKILNSLNSGDMPPEEAKQPDRNAKADFLEALSQTMVVARKALSDQDGNITMRRLNRREYQITLRDLLGVELDVSGLPSDGGADRFDTVGSSLFMSPDQFELYRELGRKALDLSFQQVKRPPKVQKQHVEPEVELTEKMEKDLAQWNDIRKRYRKWTIQVDAAAKLPENVKVAAELREKNKASPAKFYLSWDKLQGAPPPKEFGFPDAIDANMMNERWDTHAPYLAEYLTQPKVKTGAYLAAANIQRWVSVRVPGQWPVGEYKARVRLAATKEAPENRRFVDFLSGVFSGQVLSTHQVTGTMEEPQLLEIPFRVEGASRGFAIAEKSMLGNPDCFSFHDVLFASGYQANHIGPEFAVWIDWIEVEGPFESSQIARSRSEVRAMLERFEQESGNARRFLTEFSERAFRGRAPDAGFVDKLVSLYELRLKGGDKTLEAIKEPLSVLLASPSFLYLAEPASEGKRRPLSPIELATRLSFFLWSAPPDAELLALAKNGELEKSAVLAQQVERLLADERATQFTKAFVSQWLGIARLDFFQFNLKTHPTFDLPTKAACKEEVFETFAYLLRHRESLSRLLKSDFLVINGLLGGYYGIPDVHGDAFRRVDLPSGAPRGGLLGMVAILAMGGNGDQTSPVERGAWVLRKLLNDPPPPAPPNVPQLNRLAGKPLTTRERIAQHQEDAQCTQCHRKIDPIGFGLENFDAAGKWRTVDLRPDVPPQRREIDPSGALFKGPAFRDFFELRDLIAARPERFARGFTEALIEYGLGRPFGFSDETLATEIVSQAKAKDFQLSEFIHALVASNAFHSK
jgi:mono/diheme cytochrome c family protein